MCSTTDYDRPSMYSERIVTARKQHRCGECHRTIKQGEKYQYVAGVWCGDFSTTKTCQHCLSAQNLLLRECNARLFGGVQEDLEEHLYEQLPWSGLAARLYVGMRRQWKAFRGDGLMKVIEV